LNEIAPTLTKHIYDKNVRVIMSSSLTATESAEVAKILSVARKAPASGRRENMRSTPGQGTCGKGSLHRC
jgi:hypothetical protein